MSAATQLRYSYDDYLRALEESQIKLEFAAGAIYAMAGGTLTHGALSARASHVLQRSMRGGCTTYSSDVKVRVETTDFAGFPDVSVVCGKPVEARIDKHAIINPVLVVEVTSRSTEAYDRGEKLAHYQQLPAVQVVMFISHRERRVTLVERTDAGWVTRELRDGVDVTLREPAATFAVNELYEGIDLDVM